VFQLWWLCVVFLPCRFPLRFVVNGLVRPREGWLLYHFLQKRTSCYPSFFPLSFSCLPIILVCGADRSFIPLYYFLHCVMTSSLAVRVVVPQQNNNHSRTPAFENICPPSLPSQKQTISRSSSSCLPQSRHPYLVNRFSVTLLRFRS
jgi:hypothetical protein